MIYSLSETKQSFFKTNSNIMIKVIVNSLETVVWLLLYSKDNISRDHVWNLFSFFLKDNFITILHSFLNNNIKFAYITNYFSTSAVSTICRIDITSTSTLVTLYLHLHLHSKAHLNFLHNLTLTMAFRALLSLSILCTCTSTFRAIYISCNGHVSFSSKIKFF